MLRHSSSQLAFIKKDRRNRGRETSNFWAMYVAMIWLGDSSGDSMFDTIPKVPERMSMSCIGEMVWLGLWSTARGIIPGFFFFFLFFFLIPLLCALGYRTPGWSILSRQLEASCVHGDAAGRNSSSRELRSSQWTYLSIKHIGKSSMSISRGMSCNLCESPGFRACRIKSPLFHENKIFDLS